MKGARPRGFGRLDKTGSDVRVHVNVSLFGEDWVQSIGVRLDRMCLRRDLNLEGAQKACTVSSLDNEKVSAYSVNVSQIAPIALGSQPAACSTKPSRRAWGVQCFRGEEKIRIGYRRADYPADVCGGGGSV